MLFSTNDLRFAALLAVVCLAGCRPQEQIARYTVPKPDLLNPVSSSSAPAAAPVEQAILGAIIPVGDQSWFFKLTGEPKAVELQREAFLEFVKTVKFTSGAESNPTWTLPAGWKELPGSEFRFATIQLAERSSAGKPLEIAVSSAGGSVLDNVNRWRKQVSLDPIDVQKLAQTTETFQASDKSGTFVLLVGTGSSSGMGGAPFAPFAGRGAAPPPLAKKAAEGPMAYELPPEWKIGPRDAISAASFTTDEGPEQIKITITSAGGDLLSNVNRWRDQVGLRPIEAADLASSVKKIETLGVQGDYVELIGPGDVAKSETILGVMAALRGQTWFVKLKGDTEIAAREKPRFEAFVKSLKIK